MRIQLLAGLAVLVTLLAGARAAAAQNALRMCLDRIGGQWRHRVLHRAGGLHLAGAAQGRVW